MIYPLDAQISLALSQAYDPETGELVITEEELLEEIQRINQDRDVTIDSIACEVKNLRAEAEAVKEEKKKLADRQAKIEAREARAERLLAFLLQGERWKNGRHNISYRKSSTVVIEDGFVDWALDNAPDLLTYKDPEPRKQDIAKALKDGFLFDYAHLEQHNNIQIK